jgi:hypothetical protein
MNILSRPVPFGLVLLILGALGCSPLGLTSSTGTQGHQPIDDEEQGSEEQGSEEQSSEEDEDDLNEGNEESEDESDAPDDESDAPDDEPDAPDDEPDAPDDEPEDSGSGAVAQDAAELVSVDLPTELTCATTYSASIEMRNTGLATWTRAGGYKLGTVDDSDPFYNDTRVWLDEGDSVAPGQTHTFEFELSAPNSATVYTTDWQMVHEAVAWFGDTTSESIDVTCSATTWCDPLTGSSATSGFADKTVNGGNFSAAGWQTTSSQDQLLLQLDVPLGSTGSLSIDVSNFDPTTQYTGTKHQIINMYTTDDGSQGVFQSDEAWWNIRTGSNYGTGFKILAAPNGGDSREEARLIENASWNPNQTYTFTVSWDAQSLDVYVDGAHLENLGFHGRVRPLEYIFIGKDNVYDGQVGPIYSNLCVSNTP